MSAVLVLATFLRMATEPVSGVSSYAWEAAYKDGVVEVYTTSDPVLEFTPRAGRVFTLRVSADGSSWSQPSYEVLASPLAGDVDFDGVVGAPDFSIWSRHFGEVAP